MVGDVVAVVGGQGVQDVLPAVGLTYQVGAVLVSGGGDEVERLYRGLLVGEVHSMPYCPSKSGVEAVEGVGGGDDSAQLGGDSLSGVNWSRAFRHDRTMAG